MERLLISVLLCCAPSFSSCLQWSGNLPDGQSLDVCVGDDVTFPWNFTLGPGESVASMEWLVTAHTQRVVAFFSHGTFIPLTAFSGRVERVANGGLLLRHVTAADRGNYSIEIDGYDVSGSSFSELHTAVLSVTSPLMTSDDQLHVTQFPRVVHDDVTGQWSLQLSCGNFTYTDHPPFDVEWLTPQGSVHSSSSYSGGQFHFLLPAPPQTGRYTCRLPDRWAGTACLPNGPTASPRASVVLDGLAGRLTLLEAEQDALRRDNLLLRSEKEALERRLQVLESAGFAGGSASGSAAPVNASQHLTQLLHAQTESVHNLMQVLDQRATEVKDLTEVVDRVQVGQRQHAALLTVLKDETETLHAASQQQQASVGSVVREVHLLEETHLHDNAALAAQLSHLQAQLNRARADGSTAGAASAKVSFHAQLSSNEGVRSGHTLVLSTVYNNDGHAYSNITGCFSAPFDGTYFFIASAGSYSRTRDAYMELVVDGQQLATAYAHRSNDTSEMATCHGVAALTTGQQVWLVSLLDGYFNYADTFFSGFLVHSA